MKRKHENISLLAKSNMAVFAKHVQLNLSMMWSIWLFQLKWLFSLQIMQCISTHPV